MGAEASDMDSVAGISESRGGVEVIDQNLRRHRSPSSPGPRSTWTFFVNLDGITLRDVFDTRTSVTHSVPDFLEGAFRGAGKGGFPKYPQRVRTAV